MSRKHLSPLSRVSKFLIKLIPSILVCLVLAATSVTAYTETTDGVEKTYTWDWQGGLSSVRSQYDASPSGTPRMIITGRMFGTKVTQNGGVETSGKLMNDSINASDPDQNRIDVYAEIPSNGLNASINEKQVVWLTSSTGSDDNFVTESDFSFTVKLSTLDYYDNFNNTGIGSLTYVSQSRIRLMSNGSAVKTLTPTYTTISSVQSSVQGLYLYDYEITFSLDNPYGARIEFDTILFDFPCAVNLRPPYGGNSYYSRYYVSISNPVLVTVPTEEMLENLIVSNASNDDLIGKLGTVNAADQDTLDSFDNKSDELKDVVAENSELEEQLDLTIPDYAFAPPDEVELFSPHFSEFWATFVGGDEVQYTGFHQFMRSVISIPVLAALVSLILFGAGSGVIIKRLRGE